MTFCKRHTAQFFLVFLLLTALCLNRGASAQTPPATPQQRIQSLTQEVGRDLQQQKPQLAIPLLREIVTLDPSNVDARGNLGVLLYFQGKYEEAIPEMRAAVQARAGLWKIQALLGNAEKRVGDLPAAQNDLEQAFPNLDEAKLQVQTGLELLEVYSATGQLEKSVSVAAKLESISPQDPEVLFAAYQISLQMLDQSLISMTLAAPDSPQMHMMMAEQLVHQRDSAGAIAQYREAIRLNPQLPGVHFELAEQLRSSTDPAMLAQAEAEYRTAIKVNPYDSGAWRGLGELLAQNGKNQDAKDAFNKALAQQPNDSDAKTDLAKLLIAQNQQAEALPLLESVVKDDPTNVVAHYRLSLLYRQAGRSAEAKREMDSYLHYKELHDKLGKVFLQMRDNTDDSQPAGPAASH